jgi:phosphonoacetaldehyde hydrolase
MMKLYKNAIKRVPFSNAPAFNDPAVSTMHRLHKMHKVNIVRTDASKAATHWIRRTNISRQSTIYINVSAEFPIMINKDEFIYPYKIEGVVGDWAGSILDPGSLGPIFAFIEAFRLKGIIITAEEARIPMGLRKDIHIEEILKMKRVRDLWYQIYKRDYTKEDIMDIYNTLVPIQIKCLDTYSTLIEGAVNVSMHFKNKGIKFGCTTGYTKAISDVVLKKALEQGLHIDCVIAGDDVENGSRPNPYMVFKFMEKMGLKHSSRLLKFDDTPAGIKEGLNAGCITVGLAKYSSCAKYNSLVHIKSALPIEVDARTEDAAIKLLESGAHYVVDDINDIPDIIKMIEHKQSKL